MQGHDDRVLIKAAGCVLGALLLGIAGAAWLALLLGSVERVTR